jgi:diguanylate cyclase (GGDEF)-like protein
MKKVSLRVYAVVMALAVVVLMFSENGSWFQVYWQVGVGWAAAAAVVLGMRWHRPDGALVWYLFAAGVFLNASGILAEAIGERVFHQEGYPTIADPLWLCLYPGLAAGMIMLIRRRTSTRNWPAIVDTTTITTGLGLLSWVFVIRPQAADETLSMLGRAVVVAYPVGDVVIFAMIIRLLIGGQRLPVALRLMSAAVLTFLVGDIGWAVLFNLGIDPGPLLQHVMEAIFLVAYALVGAAGLHRSVAWAADRTAPREASLSPWMLGGLTVASLMAPALLIFQAVRSSVSDPVAIGVSSATLFLLVVTRMAGLLRQVQVQAVQLRNLARVDELTGLPNRRAWFGELPLALERARRDGRPVSVAILDLDHFKKFNDTYGHPAGDQLLRGAANGWVTKLRTVDTLGRYGGEEFVALLPAAGGAEAAAVIDRLREATPSGQTFSCGVATWDGQEPVEDLIARADKALYEAKAGGRNRTVVHGDERSLAEAAA